MGNVSCNCSRENEYEALKNVDELMKKSPPKPDLMAYEEEGKEAAKEEVPAKETEPVALSEPEPEDAEVEAFVQSIIEDEIEKAIDATFGSIKEVSPVSTQEPAFQGPVRMKSIKFSLDNFRNTKKSTALYAIISVVYVEAVEDKKNLNVYRVVDFSTTTQNDFRTPEWKVDFMIPPAHSTMKIMISLMGHGKHCDVVHAQAMITSTDLAEKGFLSVQLAPTVPVNKHHGEQVRVVPVEKTPSIGSVQVISGTTNASNLCGYMTIQNVPRNLLKRIGSKKLKNKWASLTSDSIQFIDLGRPVEEAETHSFDGIISVNLSGAKYDCVMEFRKYRLNMLMTPLSGRTRAPEFVKFHDTMAWKTQLGTISLNHQGKVNV